MGRAVPGATARPAYLRRALESAASLDPAEALRTLEIPDSVLASWQDIVDTVAELIDVPAALITRLNGEQLLTCASSRTAGNPYPAGGAVPLRGYCEAVIRGRSELKVADALNDPEWKHNPDVGLSVISYLGYPIFWPDGAAFGTICVSDCKSTTYSETHSRLMRQSRDLIEHQLAQIYADSRRRLNGALERRRDQEAMRSGEERFAKAFRLAPVPMLVAVPERFRILDVNEAFLSCLGYSFDETVGHEAVQLGLLDSWDPQCTLRRALEDTGHAYDVSMQLLTPDGIALDCLVSAEMVTFRGQRCMLCVFQDVSERRRSEEELVAAIEAVMQESSWFSRSVVEKLAQIRHPHRLGGHRGAQLADLTPRETEVLELMCEGRSDGEIAQTLNVSRNTVRNYVAMIYSKIDVHRRSAAVIWARERGIIGSEAASRPKGRRNATPEPAASPQQAPAAVDG